MAHVLRVPKLDLASILAQQNPEIDLRIEAYETSTRNFLKAVSHYAQNAQAEITRRKTTHLNEKKRVAEVMDELVAAGAEDVLVHRLQNCRV